MKWYYEAFDKDYSGVGYNATINLKAHLQKQRKGGQKYQKKMNELLKDCEK